MPRLLEASWSLRSFPWNSNSVLCTEIRITSFQETGFRILPVGIPTPIVGFRLQMCFLAHFTSPYSTSDWLGTTRCLMDLSMPGCISRHKWFCAVSLLHRFFVVSLKYIGVKIRVIAFPCWYPLALVYSFAPDMSFFLRHMNKLNFIVSQCKSCRLCNHFKFPVSKGIHFCISTFNRLALFINQNYAIT